MKKKINSLLRKWKKPLTHVKTNVLRFDNIPDNMCPFSLEIWWNWFCTVKFAYSIKPLHESHGDYRRLHLWLQMALKLALNFWKTNCPIFCVSLQAGWCFFILNFAIKIDLPQQITFTSMLPLRFSPMSVVTYNDRHINRMFKKVLLNTSYSF